MPTALSENASPASTPPAPPAGSGQRRDDVGGRVREHERREPDVRIERAERRVHREDVAGPEDGEAGDRDG